MTGPWSAGEAPVGQGLPGDTVIVVEGSTFCISEPGGDVLPGQPHGLFVRDTRVLSHWELTTWCAIGVITGGRDHPGVALLR